MARRKRKATEPLATIWHATTRCGGRLAELHPPADYGPGRIDQRKAFDEVIYRLRSGVQWNHLLKEFATTPASTACSSGGSGVACSAGCEGRWSRSAKNCAASTGRGRAPPFAFFVRPLPCAFPHATQT
jgi:hypothetical protein